MFLYWAITDDSSDAIARLAAALNATHATSWVRHGSAFHVALDKAIACQTVHAALREAGFRHPLTVTRDGGGGWTDHAGLAGFWSAAGRARS